MGLGRLWPPPGNPSFTARARPRRLVRVSSLANPTKRAPPDSPARRLRRRAAWTKTAQVLKMKVLS